MLDTAIPAKATGYRFYDDTSGCLWAVFARDDVERFALENEPAYGWRNGNDVACALIQRGESYSGPGRGFSWEPEIRWSRTRVLVTQHTGLDV